MSKWWQFGCSQIPDSAKLLRNISQKWDVSSQRCFLFACEWIGSFCECICMCIWVRERDQSVCVCVCLVWCLFFSVTSRCRGSLSICLSSWRVSHTHIHTCSHTWVSYPDLTLPLLVLPWPALSHTHTHAESVQAVKGLRKFDREKKIKAQRVFMKCWYYISMPEVKGQHQCWHRADGSTVLALLITICKNVYVGSCHAICVLF